MKIEVYAICKNEEKFVDGWVKSMSEADAIHVLDTGSCDKTVDKLKSLGVDVKVHDFGPDFRFDVARNESLAMCSKDAELLVCTDLDETFTEGWRAEVERQWSEAFAKDNTIMCAEYDYWHTMDENGNPIYRFNNFKIHLPNVAKWIYACHEVLAYAKSHNRIVIKNIILKHHQDKTKPRGEFYLSLLKKAAEENPSDARSSHYYGRELMYNGRYDEAIAEFMRHLGIPNAWNKERAQSMRYIGRCYKDKGQLQDAYYWYTKAIAEDQTQREAAMELAVFSAQNKDWEVCTFAAKNALMVTEKLPNYVTEEWCWGSDPFFYYSQGMAKKNGGDFRKASVAASIACRINPNNLDVWRNLINLNGQAPVYPAIAEAVRLVKDFDVNGGTEEMPDWSIFDHVYCIHYLGNNNRDNGMKMEFSRVGLWGRENFSVYETVRTCYEEQLPNQKEYAGIKNLALNTLKILIGAKIKGYKRIAILEDDIRFLRNTGLLSDILRNTPLDADVCIFDKMVYIHNAEFQKYHEVNRLNKYFSQWVNGIYSSSFYMVGEGAYDTLIGILSKNLIAIDDALQVDSLKKAYSIVNASCQCFDDKCMFIDRFGGLNSKNGYAFQGLDFDLYNVPRSCHYDEPVTVGMCF